MKKQNSTMDKNIKDVVQKIENKFEGISIKVYYFDMENIYYLVIPKKYFNNSEFQKFISEVDEQCFINDITNYYIVDKIHDKELDKVYVSPQLEMA
jgi:glyceraldehyde-3-phosphate dehydrogenase/erythrose-4-phosphate dehydrogenase